MNFCHLSLITSTFLMVWSEVFVVLFYSPNSRGMFNTITVDHK